MTVPSANSEAALLEIRGLAVEFPGARSRSPLRAVDGIDLEVAPHETVGLVGESGSGKSTVARAVLGLVPIAEGTISFDGRDISSASRAERRALSQDLQVVFQDPYSSLSPVRTIGQTLAEMLKVHERLSRGEVAARVADMLEQVGLPPEAAQRFPSEFSGGQRQRIAIARALMMRPRLVVCDEPVSALDLSVQAHILNVFRELQQTLQLSYLFIAHDLAVVRHLSHRIVVLYRGRVMEQGSADAVCDAPAHPYTRLLLEAAPVPDPTLQRTRRLSRARGGGEETARIGPSACPFAARCPHVVERCRVKQPAIEITHLGSAVACHRWRELPVERGQFARPG